MCLNPWHGMLERQIVDNYDGTPLVWNVHDLYSDLLGTRANPYFECFVIQWLEMRTKLSPCKEFADLYQHFKRKTNMAAIASKSYQIFF